MLIETDLKGACLLVYANKQDLSGAVNVATMTDKLGLHNVKARKW